MGTHRYVVGAPLNVNGLFLRRDSCVVSLLILALLPIEYELVLSA